MGSNTLTQLSDQTNRVMFMCSGNLLRARLDANARSSLALPATSSLHACLMMACSSYLLVTFAPPPSPQKSCVSSAGRSCQGFLSKPFGNEIVHTRSRLTQFPPSRQRGYDAEGCNTQKHKRFWNTRHVHAPR